MKSTLIIEKILFSFLLLLSCGVLYIVLTRKNTVTSENALLIILSLLWMVVEQDIMRKTAKKLYKSIKKMFSVHPKGKLHEA